MGAADVEAPVISLWPGGRVALWSVRWWHRYLHLLIHLPRRGAGGEGWFLFLIQDRWGGTCTCTHTHINTHAGEWCHLRSVNRNSRTTNQHALFSKLQGKLECESRMKGWSTDRAAERGRSFSPDYGAATDYGLRDYEGLTKKKKKKKWRRRETNKPLFLCPFFGVCVLFVCECELLPAGWCRRLFLMILSKIEINGRTHEQPRNHKKMDASIHPNTLQTYSVWMNAIEHISQKVDCIYLYHYTMTKILFMGLITCVWNPHAHKVAGIKEQFAQTWNRHENSVIISSPSMQTRGQGKYQNISGAVKQP